MPGRVRGAIQKVFRFDPRTDFGMAHPWLFMET